jgi:hypothetical protein
MPCVHLRELYELCAKHELRITSHDAVRIVCRQCHEQEVCPTSLTDGENVLRMPAPETLPGDEPHSEEFDNVPERRGKPGEKRPR